MSFDIPPMHLADNSPEARVIEAIVTREHVSPEEVIRRAIRGLAMPPASAEPKTHKRKAHTVAPVTDEELAQFKKLYPGLGQLDDVTEQQWDRILKGARKMNKEGFPLRA